MILDSVLLFWVTLYVFLAYLDLPCAS